MGERDKVGFDMFETRQLLVIELLLPKLQVAAWTDDYTKFAVRQNVGILPAGSSHAEISNKTHKTGGSQTQPKLQTRAKFVFLASLLWDLTLIMWPRQRE